MKDNLLSFLKPKKPKRHLADYQVESYIGTNNINPGQQQYHYPDSLGRGKEPLTHSYEVRYVDVTLKLPTSWNPSFSAAAAATTATAFRWPHPTSSVVVGDDVGVVTSSSRSVSKRNLQDHPSGLEWPQLPSPLPGKHDYYRSEHKVFVYHAYPKKLPSCFSLSFFHKLHDIG